MKKWALIGAACCVMLVASADPLITRIAIDTVGEYKTLDCYKDGADLAGSTIQAAVKTTNDVPSVLFRVQTRSEWSMVEISILDITTLLQAHQVLLKTFSYDSETHSESLRVSAMASPNIGMMYAFGDDITEGWWLIADENGYFLGKDDPSSFVSFLEVLKQRGEVPYSIKR